MRKILKIGAVLGFLATSLALPAMAHATSTTLGDNPDSPS